MPDSNEAKAISHPRVSQQRIYTPADNFSKDYLAWKQSQANQGLYTKNFIKVWLIIHKIIMEVMSNKK